MSSLFMNHPKKIIVSKAHIGGKMVPVNLSSKSKICILAILNPLKMPSPKENEAITARTTTAADMTIAEMVRPIFSLESHCVNASSNGEDTSNGTQRVEDNGKYLINQTRASCRVLSASKNSRENGNAGEYGNGKVADCNPYR